MRMKAAHIVDDEKFIDFCMDMFDWLPGAENTYFHISSAGTEKPRYIRQVDRLTIRQESYFHSEEFHAQVRDFDCLILHCLDLRKMKIAARLPRGVKVLWSGWGADYYDRITGSRGQLYDAETARLLNSWSYRLAAAGGLPIDALKSLIRPLRRRLYLDPLFSRAMRRIDYFSSPIPEDYELLSAAVGRDFKAQFAQIKYGTLESLVHNEADQVEAGHILIGNSATASNNHLDVFKLISHCELGDAEIVVPLSYGDSFYRERILKAGKGTFGSKFRPIVDFLPIHKYDAVISKCSVAIMGHRRQQGLGNILALLYRGARVYLNEANPLYGHLAKLGIHLFALRDLGEMKAVDTGLLDPARIEENRFILKQHWSEESVRESLRQFWKIIHEE